MEASVLKQGNKYRAVFLIISVIFGIIRCQIWLLKLRVHCILPYIKFSELFFKS